MRKLVWLCVAAVAVCWSPSSLLAQPARIIPGSRPYLPGKPLTPIQEPNSRVRAAASAVGLESTDFYGKKGYPRVIGDAVESSTSGGTTGTTGTATGNAGSTLGGGGGSLGGAGGGGGGGALGFGGGGGGGSLGGFNFPGGIGGSTGATGGGFSGLIPKGFGFGGTPSFEPYRLR